MARSVFSFPPSVARRPRRRERGITLIEKMIVVTLVAVLASMAVPAMKDWRDRARSRRAGQDLAAMAALIDRHTTDNGGMPPADLSTVGLAGRTDPWGRAYVYYNIRTGSTGGARKDKNINPINADYDLYSLGADGGTHTQLDNAAGRDDVVRGRNGRFFGLAADF